SREFDPAVAVGRPHHRDLDALVAQSGDAPRPLSFDHGAPFELEAQLDEEGDRRIERLHHDADVVHPLKRHEGHSRGSQTAPVSGWFGAFHEMRRRTTATTPRPTASRVTTPTNRSAKTTSGAPPSRSPRARANTIAATPTSSAPVKSARPGWESRS